MIEVLKQGYYIFETPQGSFVVEFLRPKTDYSHLVKKMVDGPFEDISRPDGREVLSGFRLAQTRLSEYHAVKANSGWVQHAGQEPSTESVS
jgi:hypothetical protein